MNTRVSKLKGFLGKATAKNIGWLFADHMITFAGGLFISIWLARNLGPEKFGVYGFAIALYAIAASVAQLGMGGVAVREIVQAKDKGPVVSTVFLLKAAGGLATFFILYGYLLWNDVDYYKFWLTLIISVGLFFNPFTAFDSYFDSVLQSKWRVIARKSGFIVKSVLTILFVINEWPLLYLGGVYLSEVVLSGILVGLFYAKRGVRFSLGFDRTLVNRIFAQSWPLIISSLGAILYLKMDQVMVVSILGDYEGGQYNAAVKYTSIFYFLHSVVLTSVFPRLVKLRKESKGQYEGEVMRLSSGLIYASVLVVIGTLLLIKPFMSLTFGDDYLPAVDIINVHIFSLPLVFVGAVLSKWLIIEELTRYSMLRHGTGFSINLGLNLLLIPQWGGVGASVASIVAFLFSCIVILFFSKRLMDLLRIMIKAIAWPFYRASWKF